VKYETVFEISLLVTPKPKGRPRFTRKGFAYTPKETRDYENLLSEAISKFFSSAPIEDRPLKLELVFYIQKPKSAKRDYPQTRPDLDNLMKAVMDAMNGIVYKDDSLICDISASKRYSVGEPYINVKLSYLDCVVEHEVMPS
jgi:Holliday junction resolvase RusA-like endonuclease